MSLLPLRWSMLLLVFSGCSAVNVASIRDAETLPSGQKSIGGGGIIAPNHYAVNDIEGATLRWRVDPAIVWMARIGLSDQVELGGTMWASNLPFLSLAWGSFDLGLRAEGAWMITARESGQKVAAVVSLGGYGTGVGAITLHQPPHRGGGLMGMGGGGLLYSVVLGEKTSGEDRSTLTLSLRGDYLSGLYRIDPTSADSAAGRVTIEREISQGMFLPSLTLRLPGGGYIELGGVAARTPWRNGLDWTLHAGIGMMRKD